jgi:hypothetical protein
MGGDVHLTSDTENRQTAINERPEHFLNCLLTTVSLAILSSLRYEGHHLLTDGRHHYILGVRLSRKQIGSVDMNVTFWFRI